MKIDLTLGLTPEMTAQGNLDKTLAGHMGTHFDVMDKDFPLEYTERRGIVFNVSDVGEREIDLADIDLDRVQAGMFVAFYSGFMAKEGYGTPRYWKEHPQLSMALIGALLNKCVSVIGIDFAGVRRGKEHVPTDQLCADRNVFVVENLCDLHLLAAWEGEIVMHTYPLKLSGVSGLPCRVTAETVSP